MYSFFFYFLLFCTVKFSNVDGNSYSGLVGVTRYSSVVRCRSVFEVCQHRLGEVKTSNPECHVGYGLLFSIS